MEKCQICALSFSANNITKHVRACAQVGRSRWCFGFSPGSYSWITFLFGVWVIFIIIIPFSSKYLYFLFNAFTDAIEFNSALLAVIKSFAVYQDR